MRANWTLGIGLAMVLAACGDRNDTAETADTVDTMDTADTLDTTATAPAGTTPTDTTATAPGTDMGMDTADTATAPTATADAAARTFANRAAASDQFEIESGQIAATKATDADVKAFAQKLVTDHRGAQDKLKKTSTTDGTLTVDATMTPQQRQDLTKLRGATGEAFDSLFLEQQRIAHEKMLAEAQDYAKTGTHAGLKQHASSTATAISVHLEELKKLTEG